MVTAPVVAGTTLPHWRNVPPWSGDAFPGPTRAAPRRAPHVSSGRTWRPLSSESCSADACRASGSVVFGSLSLRIFAAFSVRRGKWGTDISACYCENAYFTLPFCRFSLCVFWGLCCWCARVYSPYTFSLDGPFHQDVTASFVTQISCLFQIDLNSILCNIIVVISL